MFKIPAIKHPVYTLLVILLLHIAACLLLKPVWPWGDDFWYAYSAHRYLHGEILDSYSAFQHRIGIYIPVSFFYSLFGVNPYTTVLWPLLASIASITVLFYVLLTHTNHRIAAIGSFLLAINITQITHAIVLFPDVIIAFYAVCILCLVYHGRNTQSKKKSIICAALVNLTFSLAIITKESILIAGPFVLYLFIADVIGRKGNTRVFWIYTIGLFVIASFLHLLFFYVKYGDALHQLHAIGYHNGHDLYYMNEWKPVIAQIRAANSSNIVLWLVSKLGYILLLVYALPQFLKMNTGDGFRQYTIQYSLYLLVIYGVFFHVDRYSTIFMLDRLWMLLLAPLSMLAAYTFTDVQRKDSVTVLILLLFIVIYSFFNTDISRGLLFMIFVLATATGLYYKKVLVPGVLCAFLVLTGYFLSRNTNYIHASATGSNQLKKELDSLNTGKGITTILTDEHLAFKHIVYNQFEPYSHVKMFDYYGPTHYEATWIFVDTTFRPAFTPDTSWQCVSDKGAIRMYKKRR